MTVSDDSRERPRAVPDPRLRDRLEAMALEGARWLDVVVALADHSGCRVRLAAADCALLCEAGAGGSAELADAEAFDAPRPPVLDPAAVARAFDADGPVGVDTLDGIAMRGTAIRSGGRRVGVLLVEAKAPAADELLRAAATAIAIVAVRRDAQAGAVAESAAWFVDELRFGSRRSVADLTALGLRFGVALDQPQTAAAIYYDGADTRTFGTALSWVETPIRSEEHRAWTVLPSGASGRVELIQRRLQSFVGSGRVLAATGPSASGVEAIRASFDQAGFALRMLAGGRVRAGSASETGPTVSFDGLGLAGLLFHVPRPGLEAYVQGRLRPVLDRPELLQTLRAWYASGGSRLSVAAQVHIHRNSVGHRMDRLRTLLGADPVDPGVALELQAALTALDVLAALEPS